MRIFIIAMCLALSNIYANELDLRLPKDALKPVPIYIIINSRPDTPSDVRAYALGIIGQIKGEFFRKPALDSDGRRRCYDLTFDSLVVLDKDGRFIDIKFLAEPDSAVRDNLLQAAKSISPFPPFPLAERLEERLVGVPARMTLKCKKGWVRIEAH
ncbi:MAG: hypothetical protein PHX38_07165 [Sulfuricella sp.]|nr:hypothetical protein [Sulfuricella sp.]